MTRLSKDYMMEVAGEQRSLEAHQAAKKKAETTLRKILGRDYKPNENDEDDYVPLIPEGGRKVLYSPYQLENELPGIIFWENTPSGYRRLNVEKMEK